MSGAGSAAVVGAAGFLGSALVPALESAGVRTASLTRRSPVLSGDGALNADLLDADTVFWLASSINPQIAENDPGAVAHDISLLRVALRELTVHNPAARVVLVSSGGTVYDPHLPPPYAEDSPIAPRGAYGRAKVALESVLAADHPAGVVIRVANAYGPGQPAAPGQGVLGHWLRAIRDGRPVEVFGSPSAARDYVYVGDIAAALLAVHRTPDAPPVLNIGSGRATTLAELLEVIEGVCGPVPVISHPARGFDVDRTWLDVALAADTLGWAAVTQLPHGVTRMWEWLSAEASR